MKTKVYFAHPKGYFGTELEKAWIQALKNSDYEVVNPAEEKYQASLGSDIKAWSKLASDCDAIIVLPFEDGAWGAGLAEEARTAMEKGKKVFECSSFGVGVLDEIFEIPEDRVLSREATRERNQKIQKPKKSGLSM